METNTKIAVAAVVGVVVIGGVLVGLTPSEPETSGDDSSIQNQGSEENTSETQTDRTEVDDASEPVSGVEFRIETESIESCGTTCRDVTSTLYNTGDVDAHNVEVTTIVYSGGDLVWEGSKRIGSLEAGGSYTNTQEVDVGLGGGMKIRSNDGLITIETRIESDEKTVEFTEERDVS